MAVRNIHFPVWLGTISQPRAYTLASLFALAILCRSLLLTIIPLAAYEALGSAQAVSLLYFAVSIVGITASLSVPSLVRRLRRRWVFSLGTLGAMAAALLIGSGGLAGLVLGMMCQVLSVSCLEICLNLYVMDHVPRKELGRFEPFRVLLASGSFMLGPWLGVYLGANVSHWAPFLAAIAVSLLCLGFFWFLRLTEDPAVAAMKRPPPKPLANLPRFFAQPRLRLAWILAMGRSSWWAMYFVYAPIYVVQAGYSKELGGAIVSIACGSLFIVPLWGWFGRRFGLRRLLIAGYLASGLATLSVALMAGLPDLAVAVLLVAAFASGVIDGAGNLPFLRAVHPTERPQMTSVFMTFRDVSQLAPPGIFALLLQVFALPAVFTAAGAGMLYLSSLARHIPRRL
jgi:ACDE family multidrug resistance protein